MDFRLALACMIMTGTAVGLAVPGGLLDRQAGLVPAKAGAAQSPQKVASTARIHPDWGDAVVLERERDGHYYAEVQVDGQPFRMLVDTGASVIALTAEDAEAMGLSWQEDQVRAVAQGASGPVEGVHTTIDRVSLGNHEAAQVQAIIVPEGLGISLLGQSFLGTIGSVRISGDQMVLGS